MTGLLLRFAGRAGTTVPGRVALALDPRFLDHARSRIRGPVGVVSATNGKTTTCALACAALSGDAIAVGNSAGANMAAGIAATLAAPADPASAAVFELDEFWLGDVAPSLRPDAVLLGNLFRDQLDRYGELDTIVARWTEASDLLAAAGSQLIACADDPAIVWALRGVAPQSITWFGFDDKDAAITQLPHAADAGACRRCGAKLDYSLIVLGHLGTWRCPECQLSRPPVAYRVSRFRARGARSIEVTIEGPDGRRHDIELPMPGVYNAYNVLGAWALSLTLGTSAVRTADAFRQSRPAFGRGEVFDLDGTEVNLMLVKNPTGANEVSRTLLSESGRLNIHFCLNDQVADGRDVSWIWDADFEDLAGRIGSLTCSGTRADEAALRFAYAGLERGSITVEPDLREGLRLACAEPGPVWVLPTYTAMLGLRSRLSGEGYLEKVV